MMASRSDKYTMIRSMVTTSNDHPTAGTIALTGFNENAGPVQPNFGSIISKDQVTTEALPSFFMWDGEYQEIFLVESKVMAEARWAKLMILFW